VHYGHFARKPKHVGVVSVLYVTVWPTSVLAAKRAGNEHAENTKERDDQESASELKRAKETKEDEQCPPSYL
jgi:hypothetical protein